MMKENDNYQIRLETECYEKDKAHRFVLHYYIFKDEGLYIAYCPALDLTTSGKDFNDAIYQFYENFQLYVECCLEQGTLMDDLLAHGWKLDGEKLIQPSFTYLLSKEMFVDLLDGDKEYDKLNAHLDIPALAV